MHALKLSSALTLIRHVAIELNEPVMVWGQPGVGKSEGVGQLTADLNGVMCDVRLSQYDSVDLRGIPVPLMDEGLTVWHAPATLPFMGNPAFPDDRPIILFLDELTSAAPAVAAVAYQLVNDRGVGEHRLKPNVRVVAAGNRDGDKGVTTRMPTPLANRFTHCEVVSDVDDFCYHIQQRGLPAIGVAFMQFRKNLLNTFDPARADKAFATPRTWVKALRYYAAQDTGMPYETMVSAISGAVGEGPATEFIAFTKIWRNIISVREVLADPKRARLPESDDVGMAYAVAVSLSGSMTMQNSADLTTYLLRMPAEYAVLAWHLATKRDAALWGSEGWKAASVALKDVW